MDARTRIILLLDRYGGLLADNQRDAVRLAYEEDLSLSEIAEQKQVSRQAAHGAIKRGVEQLERIEGITRGMEQAHAWRAGVADALSLPEEQIKKALEALLELMEDRYGV